MQPIVPPPRFAPIRWGEFRAKRYEGDVRDAGEEVQAAHFELAQAARATAVQ